MTKLVNRAKMTTASTGTGSPITLGSAVDGYQTFAAAGVADADVVRYVIEDGVNWEIGTGTYSAGTLTRTVSESSNADAAINLSGSAVVYVSATSQTFNEKSLGLVTGNANLDLSTGTVFQHTPTANVTFSFNNPPATGAAYKFDLIVTGANVAEGFVLSSASYDSVSYNVGGQEFRPYGVTFNDDGTKMYIVGVLASTVFQYALSTAYNVSNASFSSQFAVSAQAPSAAKVAFGDAGGKMFILDIVSDAIYQYSLSTPYEVSTASYDSISYVVTGQEATPKGLAFSPDGTKMYVVGDTSKRVFQYNLATPWNLGSGNYSGSSYLVSSEAFLPYDVKFSNDGLKMFVLDNSPDIVWQYDLSVAWQISTASFSLISYDVTAQENNPWGISFSSDGVKMYVIGRSTYTVHQYTTSGTPSSATLTYPPSVKWPSGLAPTAPADGEIDLLQFLTTDGGATYLGRALGDNFS